MRETELSTVAVTTAILVLAAPVASFLPTRRASRIDAITALHQE